MARWSLVSVSAAVLGLALAAPPALAHDGGYGGGGGPRELIRNGSFEDPAPTTDEPELRFADAIRGWREIKGCGIELWANGFIRTADTGVQLVELGSNCAGRVRQFVHTRPGATYRLSYAIAARNDVEVDAEDNQVAVLVDGRVVDRQSTVNEVGWDTHTLTFRATRHVTRVAFAKDGGTTPSIGSLLDSVSLHRCGHHHPH